MNVDLATKEDIEEVKRLLTEQNRLLQEAMALNGNAVEVVDVADICRMKRMSKTDLYRKPYYLPNLGVSDFPDGRKRWRLSTYRAWEGKPIEERKAMWDTKLENELKLALMDRA